MSPSFPFFYPILDAEVAAACGWTIEALAAACLRGGARLLQLRAKRAGSGDLLEMATRLVALAHPAGARVIVNDRADVAVLAGADGVHVGQEDLRPEDVRRAFPALGAIGLSTHTPEQFAAAMAQPATYLAVGPVYRTGTKDTGYGAVGLELVREGRRVLDAAEGANARPLVAIGGITLDRAPEVIAAGASSVAVISDILSTGDPEARVRAYIERLASGL